MAYSIPKDELLESAMLSYIEDVKKYAKDVREKAERYPDACDHYYNQAFSFFNQTMPIIEDGSTPSANALDDENSKLKDELNLLKTTVRESWKNQKKFDTRMKEHDMAFDEMSRQLSRLHELELILKPERKRERAYSAPRRTLSTQTDPFQVASPAPQPPPPPPTTTTTRSTSPLPQAAADASAQQDQPRELRTRHSFSITTDNLTDVKQLSSTILVGADRHNGCIVAWGIKGREVGRLTTTQGAPYRMAVVDDTTVAVSLLSVDETSGVRNYFLTKIINIVEVTPQGVSLKNSFKTKGVCDSLCLLKPQFLAIACKDSSKAWGVSIYTLRGKELSRVCSRPSSRYLTVSPTLTSLVMSTYDDKIVKICLLTGAVTFNKSVPEVKCPRGVAVTEDESIIVADALTGTLSLLSADGDFIKNLNTIPAVEDGDVLWGLGLRGSTLVACTLRGSVRVMDVLY